METMKPLLLSLIGILCILPQHHRLHGQETTSPKNDSILAESTIVDLTHPFDENTIYWPTEAGFDLIRGIDGVTDRGYYYSANRFKGAEHGGTHVDAPIHFFKDRQTVDQIPLQRLIGEAAVVDVTEQCADADYQVSVSDLRRWEEKHGRQLVDVVVLLRTGYAQRWPNREQYLGTAERGEQAVPQLHFPGLAPDAARWLVEHRSIKAIGIDTASIDHGPSTDFIAHQIGAAAGVPNLENLADVSSLPPTGFLLMALPMKIENGTGAPVRAVALVPPR